MDPDCLFCKILTGDVPGDVVAESEHTLAFRDINPQAPTHVLVVSRSHYPNAEELARNEPATMAEIFDTAATVAEQEGLGDYRTVFNTGAGAGQEVFHVHLHLLGGRRFSWPPG